MKNDDTNPFGIPVVKKKKPRIIYFTIAVMALVIILLVVFLLVDKAKIFEKPQVKPGNIQDIIGSILVFEAGIQYEQKEILKIASQYKEGGGEDLARDMLNLSKEEEILLNKKMREATDQKIKSLLQEMLEKYNAINDLKNKIKELELQLPLPHIVEKGENHFQIALDYLVKEKGIEEDKARELINKNKMAEVIIPGFKVWNFYSDQEFNTFVTQGNAAISPEEARHRARQQLIAEKNRALRELNSLYYIIGLKKDLLKKGILEGGFLKPYKLQKVPGRYFKRSIDLRKINIINVYASSFKIAEIDQIVLFPRIYKEREDYRITIRKDKRKATLTFLNRTIFKKEKIVISVE